MRRMNGSFDDIGVVDDIAVLWGVRESSDPRVARVLGDNADRVVVSDTGGFYCKEADLRDARMVINACVNDGIFEYEATRLHKVLGATFESYIAGRRKNARGGAKVTSNATDSLIGMDDSEEVEAHTILKRAVDKGASDVHLDVRRGECRLDFRVDGLLKRVTRGITFEEGMRLVRTYQTSPRFAGQEIDERGVSDGQFEFEHKSELYSVRVNIVGTINNGVKLVARIRNPTEVRDIDSAGYLPDQSVIIQRAGRLNEGLALIVGPTNSGKSTTLTSIMAAQPRTRCVLEIADPVEAELDNVVHIEMISLGERERGEERVKRKIDSTTRQDTDLLVVGEIRDRKSAEAAERMAEQGKLVFSTLHTASVTQSIKRLITLGMTASMFGMSNFLRMVCAQKLIGTLCQHCCLERPAPLTKGTSDMEVAIRSADHRRIMILGTALCNLKGGRMETGLGMLPKKPKFRYVNETGCERCNEGILGRTIAAEAMKTTEASCEAYEEGGIMALRKHLLGSSVGMVSLREHALAKVCQGFLDPFYAESRVEDIGIADLSGIDDLWAREISEALRAHASLRMPVKLRAVAGA